MSEKSKEPRFYGDVTEKSHKNMSRIKGKDTSIEIALRKALWKRGYRYRKNYKGLPGTPDIAITKYKIAIFCDSEFFHGKDWEMLKIKLEKGKNAGYWTSKIQRNIERDEIKNNVRQVDQNAEVWRYLIRMDDSLYFTCGHSIDYTILKDGINHIYEVLDFVYYIVDEYLSS